MDNAQGNSNFRQLLRDPERDLQPTPFSEFHPMPPALIEANIAFLESAQSLLAALDDERFSQVQVPGGKSGIGAHLRHVSDHYECVLDCLENERDTVDYDHRNRSPEQERSVQHAADCIALLLSRLRKLEAPSMERPLRVRMRTEIQADRDPPDSCLSSVGRELQFLVSHTVHHFAIIAMHCDAMGVSVPQGFGVAPSTLHYRAARDAGG